MEGVIRRARYARYGSTAKRRRKTNVRQELIAKIIKQLIVCILILFIMTVIKLLNFSATNYFIAGCKDMLERETNMQSVYGAIDNMVNIFKKSDITDMFTEDAVPASMTTGEGSFSGKEASTGMQQQAIDAFPPSADSVTPGNNSSSTPNSSTGGTTASGNTSSQAASSSPGAKTAAGTAASQAAITVLKQKYSFQFPVEGIITSGYGNRIHPIKKTEEFHNGIDIEAPKGTPVKSALDGEVLEVSEDPSFGKFLRLKTDSEIVTLYAHCSQILVSKGQKIKKGVTIARVGETGYSQGTHLHFEVWVNGKSTNPAVFFER